MHKSSYNTFYTKISDATGLKINQKIDISGYGVGYLDDFYLNKDLKVVLKLKVRKDILVSKDSYMFISLVSLFSSAKNLTIKMGIGDNYIKDNSYLYNSQVGIDLNKFLDFLSYYLQEKTKQGNHGK